VRCAAVATDSAVLNEGVAKDAEFEEVRTRFAPSPTGNLHVGGARTALFNWLYARKLGGKFILRVEDTDTARSTRESEEAMLRDLAWLGLDYDEGPNKEGPYGPYRQSERGAIYRKYVDYLVEKDMAYPCFCTDEELTAMKEEAEELKIPPIYRGKWATATPEEVAAEMEKGTPFTYRFRVPKDQTVEIDDYIRGKVAWETNTLGDFIILRSNGMPVYNFCVTIDDALMRISHVIRAEEHLANTLRQALLYDALGLKRPEFAHVSLILAPDRSKLSKRHGATSVGQFNDLGYMNEAMLNFLALLGWNDGTEKEIFTVDELIEGFSLDRITKSPAVFDNVKLGWMNGEYLKAKPAEELRAMVGEQWKSSGLLTTASGELVEEMAELVVAGLERISDADEELRSMLDYPLEATLASDGGRKFVEAGAMDVLRRVAELHAEGALLPGIEEEGWKKWTKALGKELGVKGKHLFMPLRIAFSGRMAGPDLAALVQLLLKARADGDGDSVFAEAAGFVPLEQRLATLAQVCEEAAASEAD